MRQRGAHRCSPERSPRWAASESDPLVTAEVRYCPSGSTAASRSGPTPCYPRRSRPGCHGDESVCRHSEESTPVIDFVLALHAGLMSGNTSAQKNSRNINNLQPNIIKFWLRHQIQIKAAMFKCAHIGAAPSVCRLTRTLAKLANTLSRRSPSEPCWCRGCDGGGAPLRQSSSRQEPQRHRHNIGKGSSKQYKTDVLLRLGDLQLQCWHTII